jgi:archaellum component FlaC
MTIHIDGLERSGNTFLAAAVSLILEIDAVAEKYHLVSALEERDKSLAYVIPVRDVLPSIVSAKLYRDYQWDNNLPRQDRLLGRKHERTGDPKELIERYSEYINYLIDHNELFIAPFHEFTKDPNRVVKTITKRFPEYSVKQNMTVEQILKVCEKYYPSKNQYLSNFPRDHAKEHGEVKEMFLSNYAKELEEIQNNINELYNRYYKEESA